MKRITYYLTAREEREFWKLPTTLTADGKAFDFWGNVADARGLDLKSIIGVEGKPTEFTALPAGHNQPWCWPMKLKCANEPPPYKENPR
jgi:hypothetical protein